MTSFSLTLERIENPGTAAEDSLGSGPDFFSPTEVTLLPNAAPGLAPQAIVLDDIADSSGNELYGVSLAPGDNLGDRILLSGFDVDNPDQTRGSGPDFLFPADLVADTANGRFLVADPLLGGLVAVDVETGDRSILSSADVGGGPTFGDIRAMVLDAPNNRVFVAEPGTLFEVNLDTGNRTLVSGADLGPDQQPDSGDETLFGGGMPFNPESSLSDAVLDVDKKILFVTERISGSLIAIDIDSGDRVLAAGFVFREVPTPPEEEDPTPPEEEDPTPPEEEDPTPPEEEDPTPPEEEDPTPPEEEDPTPPQTAPEVTLTFETIKTIRLDWTDVDGATHYKLLENPDGLSGFTQQGDDIAVGIETVALEVFLPDRTNARYMLQACNNIGCVDSSSLSVDAGLNGSIGYVKSNASRQQAAQYGGALSLSVDGTTLAVGAGGARRFSGGSGVKTGAVYVFTRTGIGRWEEQQRLVASAPGSGDGFGGAVSLSDDGNTLVVGARNENSAAAGIDGDDSDDSADDVGAA